VLVVYILHQLRHESPASLFLWLLSLRLHATHFKLYLYVRDTKTWCAAGSMCLSLPHGQIHERLASNTSAHNALKLEQLPRAPAMWRDNRTQLAAVQKRMNDAVSMKEKNIIIILKFRWGNKFYPKVLFYKKLYA
jgi:hypothetical protein